MRSPRRIVAACTSIATVAAVSVAGVVTATPAAAAQFDVITRDVGSSAFAVALNQSGTRAYVARYSNTVNAVSVFNTQTNTWDDTVSNVSYPFAITVRGDDTVYASNNDDTTISVIPTTAPPH